MEPKKQPNILLITADQLRGDCLGIAGHPDVKTPYLDDLAAQGTLYPNAYSAVPSCIAARCALLTGLSQRSHGRVGYKEYEPWDYPVTLAGELSRAGYYTQCVGKMHVYPSRSLLGFHNIDLHDGTISAYSRTSLPYYEHQSYSDDYIYWLKSKLGADRDITDTGLETNTFATKPWPYEEHLHPTNWVASRSLDFLRRRDRAKPFFLMASFVRPHPPFDAPSSYFDMYRGKALRPPVIGDWADRERLRERGRLHSSDTGSEDPDVMRMAQEGYYACITHLDHQIGRILMGLSEEGVYRNTVIVVCSDHGELLGDHYTFRKVRPYQGSIRIPMILAHIGQNRHIYNDRCDALVELRDVMPTLLEAAGVPIPDSIQGISMRSGNNREYLHGEHSGDDIGNQYIVTKTDKYCWFTQSGKEQYFDLSVDPNECVDLIGDPDRQSRIAYLRGLLINELTGRAEGYTDGVRLHPGRPGVSML